MDTQIGKLRVNLDKIIKDTMKQKMRRNMDRWRNDNMQLGEIALHNSGEEGKYFLKDDMDADGRWTTLPEDDDGPEFSRSDQWFLQVGASKKLQRSSLGFMSSPPLGALLSSKTKGSQYANQF